MADTLIEQVIAEFKRDKPESLVEWLEERPMTPLSFVGILAAVRADETSARLQSLIETNNLWDGS